MALFGASLLVSLVLLAMCKYGTWYGYVGIQIYWLVYKRKFIFFVTRCCLHVFVKWFLLNF
jgi:hypothetical protein